MNKPFFLLLLHCTLIFNLNAQVSFQKTYGTDSRDFELVESALTTPDGGILLAGYTEAGAHGAYDFFLQKIQTDGSELWMQTYGSADMDYLSAVTPAAGGGYLIAGYTLGVADSTYDAVLAKVDEAGILLWWKTFGDESTELGRGVCQRTDGSIVLLGTTVRYTTGDPDFHPVIFQAVYDSNGNFDAYFETPFAAEPSVITIKSVATADNGYLLHNTDGDFFGSTARLLKFGSTHAQQWEKSPSQIAAQIGQSSAQITEVKAGDTEIVVVLKTGEGTYIAALKYADGDVAWYKKVTDAPLWAGVEIFPNGAIGVAALLSDHLIAVRMSATGTVLDSVATAAPAPFFRPIFRFNGFTHLYAVENIDYNLQPDYTVAQIDLNTPAVNWQQTLGEQGVLDRDLGQTITGASDGGFVMAGNKQKPDGSWDLWLLKSDAQGNVVWEKNYNLFNSPFYNEIATSVKTDADGNIVLLAATAPSEPDYHLLKFTPTGDLIFDKPVKQTGNHYYADMLPLPGGGYVVGMILAPNNTPPFQPAIIRLDEDGNVLWEKSFTSGVYIYAIDAIPGEGFVIGGTRFVNPAFQPWVLKTDLDGNVLWEHIYDMGQNGNIEAITHTADGNLWAAGSVYQADEKQVKALVLRLDASSGEETRRTRYGKGEFTSWSVTTILPEPDGSLCLFSRISKSSPTLAAANSRFRARMSLAKIDSSGAVIAEQIFGTDATYPEISEAARTTDGDVVMCSSIRVGTAHQDAWVVKADCAASVPVTEQTSGNSIAITPNPVGVAGTIQLKFNSKTGKTINVSCFDATGKFMWTKTVPVHAGENRISLNAPRLPGTYTLLVSGQDGLIKTIQAIVH